MAAAGLIRKCVFVFTCAFALCAGVVSQPIAADQASLLTDHGKMQLRATFQLAIDEGLIAGGSLLLIEHGRVIFNEGFGYADLDSRRPFTTEEVVALASVSKPWTATVLMRLVEAGHLTLDDPISRYVPEMADLRLTRTGEAVSLPTLRQLLSHTGGFQGLSAGAEWQRLVYGPDTMAGAVAAIVDAGLEFAPGTEYAYTQLGYVVAAHGAERALNLSFEDVSRIWLKEPIGARTATFYPSVTTIAGMPVRYGRNEGTLHALPQRVYRAMGQPIDPAASLTATMEDVARLFLLHLHDGRIDDVSLLSADTIREMQRPQPGTSRYGLGLNVDWSDTLERATGIRHGGATGTLAWADHEHQLVGVLFTQTPWRQAPEWRSMFHKTLDELGLGRAANAGRGAAGQ
jgi:CubicO group peptidase (beta-lactamase class C family)